jgi:hypothetical protein
VFAEQWASEMPPVDWAAEVGFYDRHRQAEPAGESGGDATGTGEGDDVRRTEGSPVQESAR